MDLGISGKRAFVMGGSSGLGRAVAEKLIENRVKVAVCGRDRAKLDNTCSVIGAYGIQGDLSVTSEVKRMILKVEEKLGSIDILVTNTGGPPKTSFQDAEESLWEESFRNLYLSVVTSARMVLPKMKKNRWGRIILLTSMAAKEPVEGLVLSNGIRSGLLGLAKTLSMETAPFGITVNTILPGYMATDRLKGLGIDLVKIGKEIPAGRIGKPEELGSLAAFLASDAASYITGQAIAVDGGYTKGIL